MRYLIALLLAATAPWAPAQDIDALANDVEPRVIAWRRHIHQHPELGFQEVKTAAYIAEALRKMPGIEIQTGIAKTGIKAVLKGGKPGPVVALRADMDALPVEERNDLPFKSQVPGVMHACGHDAHVAMLLGAAEILSRMRAGIPGTVVFFFQPAEEGGGGAFQMVREGAMQNPKVDAVFAQHISGRAPGGTLAYRAGGAMASADVLRITVRGVGGHGASPWTARDPIVTAAHIITGLQTVVSRQADLSQGAAVVTVAKIQGGSRGNIIPEQVTMEGTIRTLHEPTRVKVHEAIKRMAEKTAEAAGLAADVYIGRLYPVLHNDPQLVDRTLASLERAAGKGKVFEIPPIMASEDFGAFSQVAPGFYWSLTAPVQPDRSGAPNHSPLFMIGEQYLKTGVKALVHVALDYLRAGGK